MRLHHISFVCNDIDETIEQMKEFYNIVTVSPCMYDDSNHVNMCLLQLKDSVIVELISGSAVNNLLRKHNLEFYHSCYSCDNLEDTIDLFEQNGAELIREPSPAVLFQGSRAAYLNTKQGMVELLEQQLSQSS